MYKYKTKIFENTRKKTSDIYDANLVYNNLLMRKEYYPYRIDTWNENKYYGIIDEDGDAITPNELFIINMPMDAELNLSIRAHDFVVEAFKDFRDYYFRFFPTNKLSNDYTNLNNLSVMSGYRNFREDYINLFNNNFKFFMNNIIKEEKVKTFKDFMDIFIRFVDLITLTEAPFTESGFLMSRYGDIKHSALALSFEPLDVNHNDLQLKYKKYFSNNNFDTLLQTAARFGFVIDKACPWRLVVDINSPSMIEYMRKYGSLDKKHFFRMKYSKVKYSDLNTLKYFILGFYNAFADTFKHSHTTMPSYSNCSDIMYKFVNINTIREKITNRLLMDRYDDSYFIRLYVYIKFRELKLKMNQNEFDKIVNNCQKLNKYQGMELAINYLDQFVRPREQQKNQLLTTPEEIGKILSTLKQDQIRPTFKF